MCHTLFPSSTMSDGAGWKNLETRICSPQAEFPDCDLHRTVFADSMQRLAMLTDAGTPVKVIRSFLDGMTGLCLDTNRLTLVFLAVLLRAGLMSFLNCFQSVFSSGSAPSQVPSRLLYQRCMRLILSSVCNRVSLVSCFGMAAGWLVIFLVLTSRSQLCGNDIWWRGRVCSAGCSRLVCRWSCSTCLAETLVFLLMPQFSGLRLLAPRAGFEPATFPLGGGRAIRLCHRGALIPIVAPPAGALL